MFNRADIALNFPVLSVACPSCVALEREREILTPAPFKCVFFFINCRNRQTQIILNLKCNSHGFKWVCSFEGFLIFFSETADHSNFKLLSLLNIKSLETNTFCTSTP